MKQQLTTRFDKPQIEARAKALVTSDKLDMSKINRAALNIGLDKLECLKADDPNKFEQFVLDNQEVKL